MRVSVRWTGWVFVLAGGLLVISTKVSASLFEPVSDGQLVCEATDVIQGQVTDVTTSWDEQRTAIWTTAAVQVGEVIRGQLSPGSVIRVKEVGGTVDDYTIKADGFPTFQSGEEVVMLLQPWEDDPAIYRVWGYGRGMFVVDRAGGGEATGRRHDVVEAGHPTQHVDRIPPTLVLGALHQQLRGLARGCPPTQRGR